MQGYCRGRELADNKPFGTRGSIAPGTRKKDSPVNGTSAKVFRLTDRP